jgi:hypothetical protein
VCVALPCRYYPLYTRALNDAVKGNRELLLLLPPEIVDRVKVRVLCRRYML